MQDLEVLVIGGGIAGASASVALARENVRVHLVEKGLNLGGKVSRFCCKATDKCSKCMVCNALDQLRKCADLKNLNIYFGSEVVSLSGESSSLKAVIRKRPAYIKRESCTRCRQCLDACKRGAIWLNHPLIEPRFYYINRENCVAKAGGPCTDCRDACPSGCINLEEEEEIITLNPAAIVLSTGYDVFDARIKSQFGYGRFYRVMTGRDLEHWFFQTGALPPTTSGKIPRRIAFVQCVGSRDPHTGRNYCSRVCCALAARMARLIRHTHPETIVTVFYIDLQTFGRDFINDLKELRDDERIRLVKGIPARIFQAGEELKIEYEDMTQGRNCMELFDLAVLSVGMGPGEDCEKMAQLLDIKQDAGGFFSQEDLAPTGRKNAIFAAGACKGPMDIRSSILDAQSVSAQVLSYLGSRR